MLKMMFFRLPISVADDSLPLIPSTDVESFVPYDVESAPYDHWIFDNGAASIEGLKQGKLLTPQSSAPTFASTHMTMSALPGNALLTDFSDSDSQTVAIIFKIPTAPAAGKIQILAGTIENSSGNGMGSAMFLSGSLPSGVIGNARGTPAQVSKSPFPGSIGDWVFAAYSEVSAGGATSQCIYIGGVDGGNAAVVQAGQKSLSPHLVALGNGYYTGGVGTTLEVAEFLLYDRGLSVGELDELYLRSKERMERRGMTLV